MTCADLIFSFKLITQNHYNSIIYPVDFYNFPDFSCVGIIDKSADIDEKSTLFSTQSLIFNDG